MKIQFMLFIILLMSNLSGQAQSKKELLQKNEELQKSNLKLEKANATLTEKVKNLEEQAKRLEAALATAESAEKAALLEKEKALVAREMALQAKAEADKAKEIALQEHKQMEEILAKASQENPKLRQTSIAGRYYLENEEKRKGEYIELFDDGTLLIKLPKSDKNALVNNISGTYKLKGGNKITLIATLFTMTTATNGRVEGNRLIVTAKGKEEIYIRK